MTALTERQEEVMLFIQREFARSGRAPRMEDIVTGCGLSSKSRAHAIVSDLEALGFIARDRHHARGITILRLIPDDRFEAAARAACEALGQPANDETVAAAREAIVKVLITERQAA